MLIAWIVGYLLALAAAGEALRRLPPLAGLLFWVVVPLALLPWWLQVSAAAGDRWTPFLWVKLGSVVAACVWLTACRRFPDRISQRATGVPLYLFLVVNILEAVVWDGLHGNWINAAAGALLIPLAPSWRRFAIERDATRDLLYGTGRAWVLAYTWWNLVFVYGNWGSVITGQHLAVLTAPVLLAALTGWPRWIQARAYTLGLHLVVFASTFAWMRAAFDTSGWRHATVLWAAQVLSVVAVIACVPERRRWR